MSATDPLDDDIEQLWVALRGLAADRVRTLHVALRAARAGELDESVRATAEGAAHKLAGALGSYRRPSGSAAAAAAERALSGGRTDAGALGDAVIALERVLAGEIR